MQSMCSIIAD